MDELIEALANYLEEVVAFYYAYELKPDEVEQLRQMVTSSQIVGNFFDRIESVLAQEAISFIDSEVLPSLG